MPRPRNNEKAARAIAEWALNGFKYTEITKIANDYGVTTRTIENWYAATKKDPILSELYEQESKLLASQSWADKLDRDIIELQELMLNKAKTSESLPDLTQAHRSLAELQIAKELLSE